MPKLICIDGRDHVCATTALSTYAKLASCHQAHLNMVYDSSSFHTFRHVFLLQGFTEPIIGKVGPRFPVPRVEIPRRPILSISRVLCITPKTSLPSDMFLPNSRSRSEPRCPCFLGMTWRCRSRGSRPNPECHLGAWRSMPLGSIGFQGK